MGKKSNMSSLTLSPGPGTVAEEEKERKIAKQSKKGERGNATEKKPGGKREMGEQKSTPSGEQAPERKMSFPQLKGEAKAAAELGEHPVQPTHFTYEDSKAQRGDMSCPRTHSKSGLNPNQSQNSGSRPEDLFDFLLIRERGASDDPALLGFWKCESNKNKQPSWLTQPGARYQREDTAHPGLSSISHSIVYLVSLEPRYGRFSILPIPLFYHVFSVTSTVPGPQVGKGGQGKVPGTLQGGLSISFEKGS